MALVERRIGLLFAVFLLLLVAAGARAVWIGGIRGDALASEAAQQQVTTIPLPAPRGEIVDRNGVDLAVSEPARDISATPYLVEDKVAAAEKLAAALQVPVDGILKQLARRDTGFVFLARQVPLAKAKRVAKLKLAGIDLTPSHLRTYPRGFLASQILGKVGLDNDGLSGLEYSRDKLLAGQDGKRRLVKEGGVGESINVRDPEPAVAGSRLGLTLDANIQEQVEQILGKLGAKWHPKGATAIVMDPNTGEVLALGNWPRVNANWSASASPQWARQDRSVSFNYEPGSTFKSFTVAGALEEGKVTPDTTFPLPPTIKIADRVIGESHTRGDITLTTSDILAQSSNVGAIKIGLALGDKHFDQWVRRFGFGKPTGIELPGEQQGIVRKLEDYSGSSMGNLPIGQGTLVTPIQMAQAYAAIANGGILRSPSIVRSVDGKRVAARKGHRIISTDTSIQLRRMLEGAFAPGGTAQEVALDGYELAGKTGTANKIDSETGEYSDSRYIASFFGFVPALKPKLLIGVVVDEPKGDIYGGTVAAPAFGEIASFALRYLRIPPQ